MRAWHHDCERAAIIDKSRGWLSNFELLLHIEPEARLLICVRELGQIYGSVEARHQRTILIDFPDHLAKHDRYAVPMRCSPKVVSSADRCARCRRCRIWRRMCSSASTWSASSA